MLRSIVYGSVSHMHCESKMHSGMENNTSTLETRLNSKVLNEILFLRREFV
ncbi:13709_t:CDS:2 [Entrophospora sp. SA101]|nr:13709_t:CDS:2 [Entrophospora sp. SA101]